MTLDPTLTTMLRHGFAAAGKKQYSRVAFHLHDLFQQMDGGVFAIFDDARTPVSFERGLRRIIAEAFGDLSPSAFVSKAFAKGAGRSFVEVRKAQRSRIMIPAKVEFIRSVVRASEQPIMNLMGQYQAELRGINEELVRQALREVVNGVSQGDTAARMKIRVIDRINKVGKARFSILAHDTVIRAHAEGQLEAFQTLGITRVQAMVEGTSDGKCSKCQALGKLYAIPIDKAHGLIPQHPQCRCGWRLVEADRRLLRRRILPQRKRSMMSGGHGQWPGIDLLTMERTHG